jgi:hypothetical protein
MNSTLSLIAMLASAAALPAIAEVNVYSSRQPELIDPLMDAFTEKTGIEVNLAYIEDGIVERLQAEGDRSPADLVFTVDIANLSQIVEAGVTRAVESEALQQNVPDAYHDPDGHWWGLTTRARVVYASKERVADEDVTTYEDLASDKWRGRICTRSGTHPYNLALLAGFILHHGEDAAREWADGLKQNLARTPQGNDRAQVRAIWAGECDISLGNTCTTSDTRRDGCSGRRPRPIHEGGGSGGPPGREAQPDGGESDLEGLSENQPGQHPDQGVSGDRIGGNHLVQPAARGLPDAHPAEALVSPLRTRGAARRDREGLRVREGPLRRRHRR